MDFAPTRISLDRKLSSYSKVRWVVGGFLRRTGQFRRTVQSGAYINLGCGPNINAAFTNIDYNWRPGLDICCDITGGIPVADGIAGGIYTEHCLEHLSLEACKFVLRECHRVLAPKSTLRVVAPDLEIYARAYVRHLDGEAVDFLDESFVSDTGVDRPVALFNELFLGSGHRFIHDRTSLSALLAAVGFANIRRYAFGTGADKRLLIDTAGRASESLYVEATRG